MQRGTIVLLLVAVLIGAGGYAAGSRHLFAPSASLAADDCQTFPETGKKACGTFLAYWRDHGGLAQQGFPLSDEFDEATGTPGKTQRVQYFERAVFELHPENAPPNNVLLALLGSEKYKAKYGANPPGAASAPVPTGVPIATAGEVRIRLTPGASASVATNDVSHRVTVVKFTDNAPAPQNRPPKSGNKYVTLEVVVENLGAKEGSVGGSWLYRAQDGTEIDKTYNSSFGLNVAGETLTPGGKKQGFVVWEVPTGVAVKWLRYRATYDKGEIYFDV